MKKRYIEPKNTVVLIKMETMIAQSPTDIAVDNTPGSEITDPGNFGGREVINTPDAWEEW